jgi:predicted nucleic acid-binding protein
VALVVVYDACVLYPAGVRDLLLRLAHAALVRARWTDEILDEVFRNLLADRTDLSPEKLARTRHLMRTRIPDCLVTGYEALVGGLTLPDPQDRHVLAAAIRCGAQVLVTSNLKDFPAAALAPYGIEAKDPDDFVLDLLDLDEVAVADVVRAWVTALKDPPIPLPELLRGLSRRGFVRTAQRLRAVLDV